MLKATITKLRRPCECGEMEVSKVISSTLLLAVRVSPHVHKLAYKMVYMVETMAKIAKEEKHMH